MVGEIKVYIFWLTWSKRSTTYINGLDFVLISTSSFYCFHFEQTCEQFLLPHYYPPPVYYITLHYIIIRPSLYKIKQLLLQTLLY